MDETRERLFDDTPFEEFIKKHEDSIIAVQSSIGVPFEDNLANLETQISTICSRMEFIAWCLAKSEEYLTMARFRYMQPKRKEVDATSAGITLDYSIRKYTLFRDWIKNLDRKMERYLDKAQSVLAVMRMELDKLGYGRKET